MRHIILGSVSLLAITTSAWAEAVPSSESSGQRGDLERISSNSQVSPAAQPRDVRVELPGADHPGEKQDGALPLSSGSSTSGDIVVTGTRLRSGLLAPTPITVTSSEQLKATSSNLVSEALNQLPAFKNSSRPQNGTQSAVRDNGAAFLNLRALGAQRTLVLLDGRRFVQSSITGVPDVNLFPQDLIQRVEIVTGGASAAYGSDAVAGVVNFILDKKFTGLRLSSQAGISNYHDNALQQGSLTAGSGFGGDRGHVIASFEYFNQDGIDPVSGRSRLEAAYGIANNRAGTVPSKVIASPFYFAIPSGGLISSGPLAGTQFLPGGATGPFDTGTLSSGITQVGGDGTFLSFAQSASIKRYAGFLRTQYDLGDITIYSEGSLAQVTSSYELQQPQQGVTATAFTIFSDNAFLPDSVRTQMAAGSSFSLRRISTDFGYIVTNSRSRTLRAIGGFDWNLGRGWEINGYYMHGVNKFRNLILNDPISRNLYAASDAVVSPATGEIVCRSTLFGYDQGCVPINLFGSGSPSPESLAYIHGTSTAHTTLKQDIASFTARGTPFTLPAGDASIALGVEYRREQANQSVDAISANPNSAVGLRGFPASLNTGVPGGYQLSNALPLSGSYTVKEAFFETSFPILRDHWLARSLSLNGALRVIDYSTVGTVVTWKAGVIYEPSGDIRFRATRSRDIRAANIQELFAKQLTAPAVVNYDGVSTPVLGLRSGNTALKPEKADTLTAGAILRPSWFPGFSLAVDYYKIDVSDVIQQLSNQQTIDFCNTGSSSACAQIGRDASGQLIILTPTLNLASIKTGGIDFELSYGHRLGAGRIGVRALAGYLDHLSTKVLGAPAIDRAGDIGVNGTPHWTGSLLLNYDNGSLSLTFQERFIGSGAIDSAFAANTLANNRVGMVFYSDATVRYKIPSRYQGIELFTTINNLFNRKPPIAPASPFGVYRATNPSIYDIVGRYIAVGARLKL